MKIKLSLFLILSAISFFTYAEEPKSDWTNYAESSKSGFKIYYSKSSVKKDGEFCTVKILKNFTEPQEFTAEKPHFKFLSSVETQIINCEKNSYRGTRTEKWTELWGKGKLGKAYDYVGARQQDWSEPIKTTQIEGVLMEKVCH